MIIKIIFGVAVDYKTFENLTLNLFAYFQRKPPADKAVKMWFVKATSIPPEAGKWIAGWITREFDKLPWNLGKAFLEGWRLYKRENPGKIVSGRKREHCKDCYSEGLIWFKRYNSELGGVYGHVCRCGSCSNWKRHVGPLTIPMMKTLDELKMLDVEIVGGTDNQKIIKEDACEPL